MDKFKNKYRVPSARLQNWDYGSPGLYFITICTKDRNHYFGEIENAEMILNQLGLIVNIEWEKTPAIRPDMNLESGEFITMPNHFHGIIMIGENRFNKHGDGGDYNHHGQQIWAAIKKFRFHYAWFQISGNQGIRKIKHGIWMAGKVS